MMASESRPTVEAVLDAERRRGMALVARDLATLPANEGDPYSSYRPARRLDPQGEPN
jgi:hypothetical protein